MVGHSIELHSDYLTAGKTAEGKLEDDLKRTKVSCICSSQTENKCMLILRGKQ